MLAAEKLALGSFERGEEPHQALIILAGPCISLMASEARKRRKRAAE